jgi:hypothetical protein
MENSIDKLAYFFGVVVHYLVADAANLGFGVRPLFLVRECFYVLLCLGLCLYVFFGTICSISH